jgi:hypothetical protein
VYVSVIVWCEVVYCLQCVDIFDYIKYIFKKFLACFCMEVFLFPVQFKAQVRSTFCAFSCDINSLPLKLK